MPSYDIQNMRICCLYDWSTISVEWLAEDKISCSKTNASAMNTPRIIIIVSVDSYCVLNIKHEIE